MKKMNNKGFTLMEVLIVVAIIAVLIAIAIPVFTNQLEKARDAVSIANIRSAYAEAQVAYLFGESDGNVTVNKNASQVITSIEVKGVVLKGTKTSDNFSGLGAELPFTAPAEPGAGTYVLTFTYDADGVIQGAPTLTQP